jgi:hypothetical protein
VEEVPTLRQQQQQQQQQPFAVTAEITVAEPVEEVGENLEVNQEANSFLDLDLVRFP